MEFQFLNVPANYSSHDYPDPFMVQTEPAVSTITMPARSIYDGLEMQLSGSQNMTRYARIKESQAGAEDDIYVFVDYLPLQPPITNDSIPVVLHIDPFATFQANSGNWFRAKTMFLTRSNFTANDATAPLLSLPISPQYCNAAKTLLKDSGNYLLLRVESKAGFSNARIRNWLISSLSYNSGDMRQNLTNLVNAVSRGNLWARSGDDWGSAFTDLQVVAAYAIPDTCHECTTFYQADTNYYLSQNTAYPFREVYTAQGFYNAQYVDFVDVETGGLLTIGNGNQTISTEVPPGFHFGIGGGVFLNQISDDLSVRIYTNATPTAPLEISQSLSIALTFVASNQEIELQNIRNAISAVGGITAGAGAVVAGAVSGNPLALIGGGVQLANTGAQMYANSHQQLPVKQIAGGGFFGAQQDPSYVTRTDDVLATKDGALFVSCQPYTPATIELYKQDGGGTAQVFTDFRQTDHYNTDGFCFIQGEYRIDYASQLYANWRFWLYQTMITEKIAEGVRFRIEVDF